MATSDQTWQQYQDLANQYKTFGVSNPQDVYNTLSSKVQGFQPQYNELAKVNQAAYAYPAQGMSDFTQQYGNDVGQGPDPYARLTSILNGVGNRQGIANTMGNTINTLGGNLQSLGNSVYGNVQAVGTNLQNQIGNTLSAYGTQKSSELQAQANAIQQQLADIQQQYIDYVRNGSGNSASTTATQKAAANPGLSGVNAGLRGLTPQPSLGGTISDISSSIMPALASLMGVGGGGLGTRLVAAQNPDLVKSLYNTSQQAITGNNPVGQSPLLSDIARRMSDVSNSFLGGNYFYGYK